MLMTTGLISYWQDLARTYAVLGSPLRPSSEDLRFLEETVASLTRNPGSRFHALLLGVTPDIAGMRWPDASWLTAVDNSLAMTQAVWPGNICGARGVLCGDWLTLPLRESSCQVVIGDGSMNCVRYPEGFRALSESVRCVLSRDGIFLLRCYVQPAIREHPEEVLSDLRRAAIPSFHHFKFRLLMALQQNSRQGVAVDEVYRYWASRNVDTHWLVSATGWHRSAIETIGLYRGKDTVHTFPTLAEFRAVLYEFFEEVTVSTPSYNMGERCPTLVLRPRQGRQRIIGV